MGGDFELFLKQVRASSQGRVLTRRQHRSHHRSVTPAETRALADIKGFAAAKRVRLTRHAWQRLDERGASEGEVVYALRTANACVGQANGTWKVPSRDVEGDDLTVVVVIEAGVLVVTLF